MKAEPRMKARFGAALLLFVSVAVGGNIWKGSLKVKRITVDGATNVEENQLVQLANISVGTPMFEVDLTRVQRNVETHFFIRSAIVERNLPSTIHISVNERLPLALIATPRIMYVDEEGVLLPPVNARAVYDLPVISGLPANAVLKPGTAVNGADVSEAISLLWTLRAGNREMFHRISEVRLRNGGDIILYSAEWGVPIIFGRGKIGDKVARLEAFWNSEVAVRGTQYLQYIDLRYDGQVVARWGTPERVL